MTLKIFEYKNIANILPDEVKKIFAIFNLERPDSVRLVGGCVRDILLKKKINDFDFAVKFLPDDVIKILTKNNIKVIPTGVKYGTVTAVINHKNFEITTLRKDVEHNGRYPKTEFVDDYFFDAARRDFTINALYLDENGKIYDYFEGIQDLRNKEVKFIGDANLRIQEDFLRIFRFFRFSCFYAQSLDNEGLKACIKNKNGINILSADRIRNELFKTLESDEDIKLLEILQILQDSKIKDEIFSCRLQIANLDKLLKIAKVLQIKLSSHIKFFALILDKNINLDEIFSRLNFSNDEKKYFKFLFEKNNATQTIDIKGLRELLVFAEKKYVYDFCLLKSVQLNLNISEIKDDLKFIEGFLLPEFPINGEDLIALGFSGKELGEILLKMKKVWIERNFTIDKNKIIEILKNNY